METTVGSQFIMALVPVTLIEVLWTQLEQHLVRVVEVAHEEITLDSIKASLLSGSTCAVAVCKGADIVAVNILEVRTFESGIRALYIPVVGGNYMDAWVDQFLKVAEAIAKDFGCRELRGVAARKGWTKYLANKGWEEVNITLRHMIEE